MDPIVLAAGTALVGAMATDAWEQARAAVVALWRRVHPERADAVAAELEALRPRVLAARQAGDQDTEQALAGMWRLRLQQLLAEDPALAIDLQRLLDQNLSPALASAEQALVRSIFQNTRASGSSQIIQIGGNAQIHQTAAASPAQTETESQPEADNYIPTRKIIGQAVGTLARELFFTGLRIKRDPSDDQ